MAQISNQAVEQAPSILEALGWEFVSFNWENVIVSGMEHLAWPIVALIIVFLFKSEFAELIARLKNVKGKGFSAEFAELEKSSEKISKDIQEYKAYGSEDIFAIARIKPTAAVVEAWKEVEAAMIRIITGSKFDTKQGRRQISGYQILKTLEKEKIINTYEVSVLHELREIRNRAAHSVDRDVTAEQAEQYVDMALMFANKFNQKSNQ